MRQKLYFILYQNIIFLLSFLNLHKILLIIRATYCSPRALLNRAVALKHAYITGEGPSTHQEYVADSLALLNRILALPMDSMKPGLLNEVCSFMFDLASTTEETNKILQVTTACLDRNSSLGNDLIFNLRYRLISDVIRCNQMLSNVIRFNQM